MTWTVLALIVLHGLIHLLGAAKAFGVAELPRLTDSISRPVGVAWLAAALAMLITAVLLYASPRVGWMVGLGAVALSQAVIVTSWNDAKLGTVANALVLAAVAYGFASQGPPSLRAEYRREVGARRHDVGSFTVVTEADLQHLPLPVRRYVARSGAVGRPRVHHFRAGWVGRIRATADDPWMEFTAEQANFVDEQSRFFRMDARRGVFPVDVLHVFRGGHATMRARLLSVVPVMEAQGPEMDRAEMVTLLNDLALLAPGALIDPRIQWESIDARSIRARYTLGSTTVTAVLEFDDAGDLVDFVSDDRMAASPDGSQFVPRRWSTPVGGYRRFGDVRVMSHGKGRWHGPEGEFTYIELELVELAINGGGPGR
jgi:hypothetical protein